MFYVWIWRLVKIYNIIYMLRIFITLKFCHHILLTSVLLACLKVTALEDNCSVLSTNKSNRSPLSRRASMFVTMISLTLATSSLTLSTLSGSPGRPFFFWLRLFWIVLAWLDEPKINHILKCRKNLHVLSTKLLLHSIYKLRVLVTFTWSWID